MRYTNIDVGTYSAIQRVNWKVSNPSLGCSANGKYVNVGSSLT